MFCTVNQIIDRLLGANGHPVPRCHASADVKTKSLHPSLCMHPVTSTSTDARWIHSLATCIARSLFVYCFDRTCPARVRWSEPLSLGQNFGLLRALSASCHGYCFEDLP